MIQADIRIIKGYELGESLGSGGFGQVFRAYQPSVGREVAIKIIFSHYANLPEFIRRFEAEAHFVARLEHPRIVPLYDFWREPDNAYIVMRYLSGGSLRDKLKQGKALPLELTSRVLDQIAEALAFAHYKGIIHRDLKPENILFDPQDNAYLADFGIAKDLTQDQKLTQSDVVMGTPGYLSPEQVQIRPVVIQTDIYPLGIVVYEMLTGEHPFGKVSDGEMYSKHLRDPLPSLQLLRPDLPSAVNEVLQRATAKKAEERFAGALEFAQAFEKAFRAPASKASQAGEVTVTPPKPMIATTNPYKGLRAFQEADAADFHGRAALTDQLLEGVASASRFLAVVGPSGSGKSSVVKAGLIPALRQGRLPGSERWFVIEMLPGTHPLEELEAALLRIAINPPESLLNQLREDERGLARAVKRVLPGDENTQLVLVIDQFEEVFTLLESDSERSRLLKSLHAAVTDSRSRLRLIVTLRADFYDRPLLYPEFGDLLRRNMETVLPLSATELEQVIVAPAQRVGVSFEPGLVTAMITEINEQPGALPLLQYALTELFDRRDGATITLADYREIGGILGALARRADEVYAMLAESS